MFFWKTAKETVPERPIRISSVEWRDGQQSLLATRIRTQDMLPILPKMDEVGYECMEMWGGATFDVAIRYLGDDPWERVREFKKLCKKTPLRMLLRGQNLIGYKQYPDDVVEKFVELVAKAGIDKFLVFDGLNDVRNTETAIKAVLKNGKTAEANICYTISPVHTLEKYVQMAKDYAALGVKVIHVEDMAGMMNPKQVSDVIRAIRKEVGLPVHFHAHCIGGMADICYWEAIKAGACTVDCDVSALSLGPAHPPVESIVTCLKGTGFDPHLDMDLLAEINDYFMKLREKYKEFASKRTGVDISVLKHQIPGGMLSNLESQLKGMNAENRINEVFEEVHKVHKDFGYPPLATPFAQMVGAQATINVLTGQRYKMISNESKTYIRGMYGRPAGEIAPELKAAVLGNDKMITERPGSLIAPGWEKAKAEAAGFARTEEDVMTYALFPELAPAFLHTMKQENKEKIAQAEEILERLKEQRGGNVLSIHKKMANDPKLLQAFSQQFAICKQDITHVPAKYMELMLMLMGCCAGNAVTIKTHGELAVKKGATMDEVGEVLRLVFFYYGASAIIPAVELFEELEPEK